MPSRKPFSPIHLAPVRFLAMSVGVFWIAGMFWNGGPAMAQEPPHWLILPSSSGNVAVGEAFIEQLATALRAHKVYSTALDEAKSSFEVASSFAATDAQESDLDVITQEAQAALVHVATGQNERAKQAVEKVLSRAEQVLESLNRQTAAAQQVLNACLYLVRALLDGGDATAATQRVLQCRRLVPDVQPDAYDHPPTVMRMVKEADRKLASEPPAGMLTITSTPSGCAAWVNGRRLGTTPYQATSLPLGAYRVQVECDQGQSPAAAFPGRVHRLVLGTKPRTLHVEARFEKSVQTRRQLELRYASNGEENRWRAPDAQRIGRLLKTPTVILVTPESATTVRLDRLEISPLRVVASVWLPLGGGSGAQRKRLQSASEALVRGKSLAFVANASENRPPWPLPPEVTANSAPPSPTKAPLATSGADSAGATVATSASSDLSRQPSLAFRAIGWTAVGLGVVGLATGWTFWAITRQRQDRLAAAETTDVDYLSRQQSYDDGRRGIWLGAGLGGGLLTLSVPFWLPSDEKAALGVPWWSWLAGAAGAGLAGGAIFQFVRPRDCIDAACNRREAPADLGGLLLAHAAPLLTVPITHAIRHALGKSAGAVRNARGGMFVDANQVTLFVGGDL